MPLHSTFQSHSHALLMLCVAGSVAAHVLILTMLPEWNAGHGNPPRPLMVELSQQDLPVIVPPQPQPMETRPAPDPVQPVIRRTAEPRVAQEPILTAAPAVSPLPAAPVVTMAPEQRPPLPVAKSELPRTPPAPAPMTPPHYDAAYLNNPRPAYPLAARRRGDQGTVLLRVLVTAEGLAATVGLEKTSGHSSLDEAALTAVKSWRFVPARQGTQAIESPYVVPIVFKLD